MDNASPDEPASPPPDRWYQFGLGKLFLVTAVVAVVAAGWAALDQMADPRAWTPAGLLAVVVLVLAGPFAVLLVASLFRAGMRWLRNRR